MILYKYKGERYVLHMKARRKCPETRDWIPVVLYFNVNKASQIFVRDEVEFLERFEEIYVEDKLDCGAVQLDIEGARDGMLSNL